MWNLGPWPDIEPQPSALGAWNLSHWTTRKVPHIFFYILFFLPDTKVYAALGNHDFHPKNQLPAGSNNIYNQVAELWRPWLRNESVTLFKEGTNIICYCKEPFMPKSDLISFSQHPHEIGTDFIPILQIRRLRLEYTKSLGQDHLD